MSLGILLYDVLTAPSSVPYKWEVQKVSLWIVTGKYLRTFLLCISGGIVSIHADCKCE